MALVAPGEPADLRRPPRPGAVARSVSPWQLMDAPTLRPSTPHEGQGISTNRQSVGEALRELQSKFKDFSQQEKEARSVQEGELQKLRSDLGEEKATTECVAADVRALQNENTVLSGQLHQVAADVQGLRSALQAALDEAAAARSQDRSQLDEERARTQQMAADVQAIQSENAVLRGQLQEVAADVQAIQSENTVLRGQLQEARADVRELRSEITALRDQLRMVGELQETRQELDDRSRTLKEEQNRNLKGEPSCIPSWLKEKVDAHNEVLVVKCREHEQAKQGSQDLKKFQRHLQQLQRMEVVEVSESVPYFDPRIASFSMFLKYFTDLEPEDFQLCCILEAYSWAFHSHVLTDLEWGPTTPEGCRANHILQALNVPYARLKYSFEQLPKSQVREHEIFHVTATAYWRGLGFAEEGRWECAVQLLAIALFKDGQRTVPRAMLYARIQRALLYVLKKYFDDVCLQLENENAAWGTLLSSVAWIAIQHRQHLGTEEGLWMYFVCRWIEKQEALMAVAQRAGQRDWGTRVQELMMLLTQPDGLEAPGLVSAAPPPPPEDLAPLSGRPLAQGIYDREKALLPRFRAEEVNVRFHTASMV
eukprot:EG_transcript_7395